LVKDECKAVPTMFMKVPLFSWKRHNNGSEDISKAGPSRFSEID
jgi:hypothetical protein